MAAKPGLLAEMKAAKKPLPHQICGVTKALVQLGDEASELVEALKDTTIPASIISTVLKKRDISVSRDVIVRHRRGECKCEPR